MNEEVLIIECAFRKPQSIEVTKLREGLRGTFQNLLKSRFKSHPYINEMPLVFHNHSKAQTQIPDYHIHGMVQYQLRPTPNNSKYYNPYLVASGRAAKLLEYLFEDFEFNKEFFLIRNSGSEFQIKTLHHANINWNPLKELKQYRIHEWVVSKEIAEILTKSQDQTQIGMLSDHLTKSARATMKRLNPYFPFKDLQIVVLPDNSLAISSSESYGNKISKINVNFYCNIELNHEICIGKNSTIGFGRLEEVKN